MTKMVWREIEDNELQPGDTQYIGDKKYVLSEVYEIGYDKCPVCKSTKTYHSTRLKQDVTKPNTIATHLDDAGLHTLIKKDICLKCGHSWVGQMYIWEVYSKPTWIETQTNKIKPHIKYFMPFTLTDWFFAISLITVSGILGYLIGVALLG